MPPCLILRRDGGTLYPTRDIAAAIDRYETYQFDLSLYVTAHEQTLHFAQWMKVVELMGYDWVENIYHVPYGLFNFEGGRMSTRRGKVIGMESVLNDAVAKTLEIIKEKNPGLPGKEEIAEQVGVGAIIFSCMYNNRIKDTTFSLERMLSFDGETGPYAQYTHARACSVLNNSGEAGVVAESLNGDLLADDEAFSVIRLLYDFPARVQEAAEAYEPFIISRLLVKLAQAFNAFYHNHTVLVDDPALRQARLALVDAVRLTLQTGLGLLGIKAPQKM
jgi:arginyl-tRNA synthetase